MIKHGNKENKLSHDNDLLVYLLQSTPLKLKEPIVTDANNKVYGILIDFI